MFGNVLCRCVGQPQRSTPKRQTELRCTLQILKIEKRKDLIEKLALFYTISLG